MTQRHLPYSPMRKNYMLGVLMLILLSNAADRMALGIMARDIKHDFSLSDTQFGLLGGIAFALFYSVMGMPIARWADRGNRVTIISLASLLWSVGVAASGMAINFMQLALIRVGVAVGEAGCGPTSFSLLADYFDRNERARAIARYALASAFNPLVLLFAGLLNDRYGWRATFALLSIPGVVLALIAKLTLSEPRRDGVGVVAKLAPKPSIRLVLAKLAGNVSFLHLVMFLSVVLFFNQGVVLWQPSYFMRSFGMTPTEVGQGLALVWIVFGVSGTLVGGELSARYAASCERRQLIGVSVAMAVCCVVSVAVYLAPHFYIALGFAGLVAFAQTAIAGPLLGAMQTVVPRDMRAVAFAIAYLIANLVGMGLGPLAAGMLSDSFHGWAGEDSIRYALLVLSPGYLWAAWHAWQASRTVECNVARVLAEEVDDDDFGKQESGERQEGRSAGLRSERCVRTDAIL